MESSLVADFHLYLTFVQRVINISFLKLKRTPLQFNSMQLYATTRQAFMSWGT